MIPKPILFMHIPKTGGISLNRLMQKQYERDELYVLDNWRVRQSLKELLASKELKEKKLRMISGHFRFGLHEQLPYKFQYATILRDPVSRILSLYFYIIRNKGHNQHKLLEDLQKRLGLNSALRKFAIDSNTISCSNAEVRQVSGAAFGYGECTQEFLDLAKRNIDKNFVAVGRQESYLTFICNLSRILEWKETKVYPFNKGNYKTGSIEQSLLDEIREHNSFDVELCNWAGDGIYAGA